jgi:hypothetical protein
MQTQVLKKRIRTGFLNLVMPTISKQPIKQCTEKDNQDNQYVVDQWVAHELTILSD